MDKTKQILIFVLVLFSLVFSFQAISLRAGQQNLEAVRFKQNMLDVSITETQSRVHDLELQLREVEAESAQKDQEIERLRSQLQVKVSQQLPVKQAVVKGDVWYSLRVCESTNNYSKNTGNGYYGAYQFDLPTWKSNAPVEWRGTRPDLAPSSIQDQAAKSLQAKRGWQPWPGCRAKLGLG